MTNFGKSVFGPVRLLLVSILLLLTHLLALADEPSQKSEEKKAGEWSGEFILKGGTNFEMTKLNKRSHHIGDVNGDLIYSRQKWSLELTTTASYEYLFKAVRGKDTTIGGKDTTSVLDASANEYKNLLVNAGAIFTWKPDWRNTFTFRYGYGLDKSKPVKATLSDGTYIERIAKAFYTFKDSDDDIQAHTASLSYEHLFRKGGRSLNVEFRYNNSFADHFSQWTEGLAQQSGNTVSSVDTSVTKRYRDTPSQEIRNIDAGVKYTASSIGGIQGFNLDGSLWLHSRFLRDRRSSATYVNGEWRDSTEVRENFLYRTSILTPTLHGTYRYLDYKIEFSYSPEPYLQRLDSDTHTGDVTKGQVAHLFSVTQSYEPRKGHIFTLDCSRDESRPDYLEICWFPRRGLQYANEIYVGNRELNNMVTANVRGGYEFSFARFKASFALAHDYQHHKIEQTFSTQMIDDREYRIYTWVNGGKSHETNGTLLLSWNAEHLKAAVKGRYNIYKGTSMSGSVTESDDWRVEASAKYSLKSWEFAADMMYNSDMVRTYSTVKSLAECNAHISRTFGRLVISLDATNLLDRPIETLTVSEDETQMRSETITNNKRLFVLGLRYSF